MKRKFKTGDWVQHRSAKKNRDLGGGIVTEEAKLIDGKFQCKISWSFGHEEVFVRATNLVMMNF